MRDAPRATLPPVRFPSACVPDAIGHGRSRNLFQANAFGAREAHPADGCLRRVRCRAGRRICGPGLMPQRGRPLPGSYVKPPPEVTHEPSVRCTPAARRRPRGGPRRRRRPPAGAAAYSSPARALNTAPPGLAGQAHLHPPLDRAGVARRRPRRPRHRPARQRLLRQRHQLRLGARRDRRHDRHRPLVDLVPRPLVDHLPHGPLRRERPELRLLPPGRRPRRPQRDRHVQELLPELAAERPVPRPVPAIADNPLKGQALRRRRLHGRQRQGHLPRPAARTSAPTRRSCSSRSSRRR